MSTAPHPASHRPLVCRIEIHLPALHELFNALDPSPLVGRDIDDRVEEFIVETARDTPSALEFELAVSVPADGAGGLDHGEVEAAVQAYFAYLRDVQRDRVRRLLRDGRQALALGLAFLVVCTALGQLVSAFAPEAVGGFLVEGLLIIGWVANWRPVEIFLYEWRPMRARARLYDRLCRMRVTVNLR
jgi:hypothetical protein